MNINYKGLEHERTQDAPFVGALVSACDCKFDCTNCFNQKIKTLPTKTKDSVDIIKEITSNIFNKGIIFGGLEWTVQIDELLNLSKIAKQNGLLTMLFTGHTFNYINTNYHYILDNIDYIKCGTYQEELSVINHIEYGVVLATSNQHIYKKGVDY